MLYRPLLLSKKNYIYICLYPGLNSRPTIRQYWPWFTINGLFGTKSYKSRQFSKFHPQNKVRCTSYFKINSLNIRETANKFSNLPKIRHALSWNKRVGGAFKKALSTSIIISNGFVTNIRHEHMVLTNLGYISQPFQLMSCSVAASSLFD